MKKNDKLYVRIDYKNKEMGKNAIIFNEHIKYLRKIADERYFVGGGFSNEDGGMIMFKAKDYFEAKEIADNDPIIKSKNYYYKLYEWDLLILSSKDE